MVEDMILVETGENKLLAYIDLCGISEFYKRQPLTPELAKKIGRGFLGAIKEVTDPDRDRLSLHILSDSALLVPRDKPLNNKSKIDIRDIVRISLILFRRLVEDTQGGVPPNLSRIFITRGTYAYIEYKTDERLWNYTIGGDALVKCVKADKEEGLPFGVFTDCSEIETIQSSPYSTWQFVDHRSYLLESEYKEFEYMLGERLLPKIIKYHFFGWDKNSIKLRNYCETLLGILTQEKEVKAEGQ
jgi:hypothetical protein